MNGITLHDKEEEIIGTIILKDNTDFSTICNHWDSYLENENEPDIYEFAQLHSTECEVLNLDFYQPE